MPQVAALASLLLPTGATLLNKTFVSALYLCVKVTQFPDTSLKNNTLYLLLWCTCPLKSSRGPCPLREVPTYRPNEPLCNTTYHVRRTFWVLYRSGTLQVSDSLLIFDSARGCSIPIKKAQLASPHEWALANPPTCSESRLITATGQELPNRTSHAC